MNIRQRYGELCLTEIMHMKNGSIARAAAVVIATAILCGIVPMIGVALRNSAIATMRETNILQALAALPEGLRDCSTVLAYLFSTVGCIAIVAALAAVDLRITGSRRVVIRDVVVSAAPILYVTGVKWLVRTSSSGHVRRQWSVAWRSKFSEWPHGGRGDRIGHDDSYRA